MQKKRNIFRKAAHSLVILKINVRESIRLVFHFLLSLKSGLRYLTIGMKFDKYYIKVNYNTRKKYIHFNAAKSSEEYQDNVYNSIYEFAKGKNLSSILDIGCGTGYKLMKYFHEHETIGLEVPPVLNELKIKYPERKWLHANFRNPLKENFDLVMSIDVIEHLLDPDDLMGYISKLNFKYLALGTPDRNSMCIFSKFGPPLNKHHIREWGREEFINYAGKYFKVVSSNLVNGHEHFIIAEKINSMSDRIIHELNLT